MWDYIEIPVLFHSTSTSSMANCEIEFKLKDCKVSTIPFFGFNALVPFFQDGDEYCQIISGGQIFYSTLTIEYILDMVDEHKTSEFTFFDN